MYLKWTLHIFFFLLLSFFAHVVDSLVLSTAISVLYLFNQNYFGAGPATLSSHHHNNQKKKTGDKSMVI
jgi:hypothetical protein